MKFEQFLMGEHQKAYTGTDDDNYDMFQRWVENLTTLDRIEYIQDFLRVSTDEKAILICETAFADCIDKV